MYKYELIVSIKIKVMILVESNAEEVWFKQQKSAYSIISTKRLIQMVD